MCMIPMMVGQAVGGRTGAIIGGGLSGGVPAAAAASILFKKKKPSPNNVGTFG
jgi:hypothetical protein